PANWPTEKSKLTTGCTDTTSAVAKPANSRDEVSEREQCTAELLHPSDSTPKMTLETLFVDLSRSVARSGTSPTNQKSKETVSYVETAKTSQTNGLRNCGHSHIGFGYGVNQKNSH